MQTHLAFERCGGRGGEKKGVKRWDEKNKSEDRYDQPALGWQQSGWTH